MSDSLPGRTPATIRSPVSSILERRRANNGNGSVSPNAAPPQRCDFTIQLPSPVAKMAEAAAMRRHMPSEVLIADLVIAILTRGHIDTQLRAAAGWRDEHRDDQRAEKLRRLKSKNARVRTESAAGREV
jgi:hypothetical protein